jgi:hypothetical protein
MYQKDIPNPRQTVGHPAAGGWRLEKGERSSLDLNAVPYLQL